MDIDRDNFVKKAVVVAAVGAAFLAYRRRRRRHPRRFWMRYWFLRRDTEAKGLLNEIERELSMEDKEYYRKYFRMDDEHFDMILNHIIDDIQKNDTVMRPCIDAKKRLALALRYLATGETFQSLSISTRISVPSIRNIVTTTLVAIKNRLGPIYLQVPSTTAHWEQIATEFYEEYGFPNCIGALDGKHVAFRPSKEDGAHFYNYKCFNSIVLLALVDANKKFLIVDIGANGRASDGGVYAASGIKRILEGNLCNLPPRRPLPGRVVPMPYVAIADSAFPLGMRLMKPYDYHSPTPLQKLFNKSLSKARCVVENAFGILANRMQIFLSTISSNNPDYVELVIWASCILHNFMMDKAPQTYGVLDPEDVVNLLDYEFRALARMDTGTNIRLEFVRFFGVPF